MNGFALPRRGFRIALTALKPGGSFLLAQANRLLLPSSLSVDTKSKMHGTRHTLEKEYM